MKKKAGGRAAGTSAGSRTAGRAKRRPERHESNGPKRSKQAPQAAPPPTALAPGDIVEGVVSIRGEGYGFVTPAEAPAAGDVYLPPREMTGVLDGDRLRVRVRGTGTRGRLEGELVAVVAPGRSRLVGRLRRDGGRARLLPFDPHQPDLAVSGGSSSQARDGQVVVGEIVRAAGGRGAPTVRVVEVLGDWMAAGVEIEASIREHGLPHVFGAAALAEAKGWGDEVPAAAVQGRRDLRDLPLVTIDGADARDFDDAVCAQAARGGGGWRLWVAIADVSTYVRAGGALDGEAQERGTSVYFPEHVVPMLPEVLSNGLCSLNPGVDRLCLVCEMRVTRDGEVDGSRFYAAVIRSHARLIYEQVAALLEDPHAELATREPALVGPLRDLAAVYGALLAARQRRGAIDFESTETRIVFDADRKIEAIIPVERTQAHRIIEECMIAANVEAAKLVEGHHLYGPFRVHAKPDAMKVAQLREFLNARGLSLGGGETPAPADYAALVAALAGRADAEVVQTMVLRSLMQARYESHDDGHFGLALEHYAHFTSPIRRYPDLLLHRAIRHIVARRASATYAYTAEQMGALAQQCSMAERRADEAVRDVMTWLKCEYMSHRVGESFDGTITGVTSFGVFVSLDGLYVDGLVHVSRLGADYFEYDPTRSRMVGSRNGAVFGLGTRLRVKVTRVGLDDRQIDLEPVRGGRVPHARRGR